MTDWDPRPSYIRRHVISYGMLGIASANFLGAAYLAAVPPCPATTDVVCLERARDHGAFLETMTVTPKPAGLTESGSAHVAHATFTMPVGMLTTPGSGSPR